MKATLYLGGFLILLAGCSANPQISDLRNDAEGNVPRCLDLCASNFQQCTSRHPGDFTACSGERRDCETECRAQQAEKREEGTNKAVVPVEPIGEEPKPEPVPETSPAPESEVPMAEPEAEKPAPEPEPDAPE